MMKKPMMKKPIARKPITKKPAGTSFHVPAAALYKGEHVKVRIAKNNKVQVMARIGRANYQVLELQPPDDLWYNVCTANAVAMPLEVSLRFGDCHTVAMAHKKVKDALAELGDSKEAPRDCCFGPGPASLDLEGRARQPSQGSHTTPPASPASAPTSYLNPAAAQPLTTEELAALDMIATECCVFTHESLPQEMHLRQAADTARAARAGASVSGSASARASVSGDSPGYIYHMVRVRCPNLVLGDAFDELPRAAHPLKPTSAKYSYTLGLPEYAATITVNLQKRSYYIASWGVPPPSAGLTVDSRGGVSIPWGRHGGAKPAFELALQVACW
jgi:hypothetical protein